MVPVIILFEFPHALLPFITKPDIKCQGLMYLSETDGIFLFQKEYWLIKNGMVFYIFSFMVVCAHM